jgi:competence protein ComEA
MKDDWKEYVSFSRKERNGVIVLLILVVLISVLPYFIPAPTVVTNEIATREWQSKLAAWKMVKKRTPVTPDTNKDIAKDLTEDPFPTGSVSNDDLQSASEPPDIHPDAKPLSLFSFDPNRLAAHDWQRLGIPDKVIRTIFNYRNKGGRFRKPEDIARIYGMQEKDVKRLLPYVRIPDQPRPPHSWKGAMDRQRPHSNMTNQPGFSRQETHSLQERGITVPSIRRKKYQYIDINTADTSVWMNFPGIGSRLAFRIVQYREKLGGFHSPDQVGETWALPDSTFQKIRPWLQIGSGIFRKIRINTAGMEELRQHPYLRWQLANAIVQFREQHGVFHSATDLQKIILMTPLLISRIAPYLEY